MANNGIFDFLKAALPGSLDWNFVKFLVGRDGQVIRRYVSGVYPLELEPDIVAALALSADESSVAKMGVFAVNASKRANATAPHARAF